MANLKQLEILKQGVDAWNRYVQLGVKINLSWADLEGADLRGGGSAEGESACGEHAVGETEGGGLPDSDQ